MCKLSASFGSSDWSRIQSHLRPKLTSPLTITLESSSSTRFLWMYAWSTTTNANSVIIPELNHFGYKEAESVATFFFSLLFVRLIKRETNITTDYLEKLCKYIALSLVVETKLTQFSHNGSWVSIFWLEMTMWKNGSWDWEYLFDLKLECLEKQMTLVHAMLLFVSFTCKFHEFPQFSIWNMNSWDVRFIQSTSLLRSIDNPLKMAFSYNVSDEIL